MNPKVDTYLIDGCGRCSLYQTPHCKVNTWQEELTLLRKIVLDSGLQEEFKWSQPCYTFQNKNILIVTAFKGYAALAFFNGSLLKDPYNILVSPGKNSQAVRQIPFTNVQEVAEMEPFLKAYIQEAIEVNKAGLTVNFKKAPQAMPTELQEKLDKFPAFKTAFMALTPGRQRGYILHFAQPKQPKTRVARIEKCMPKILKGEGLNDHYKSGGK